MMSVMRSSLMAASNAVLCADPQLSALYRELDAVDGREASVVVGWDPQRHPVRQGIHRQDGGAATLASASTSHRFKVELLSPSRWICPTRCATLRAKHPKPEGREGAEGG